MGRATTIRLTTTIHRTGIPSIGRIRSPTELALSTVLTLARTVLRVALMGLMGGRDRVRMLTATGAARWRCGATSGRRLHIEQRRQEPRQASGPQKEHAA